MTTKKKSLPEPAVAQPEGPRQSSTETIYEYLEKEIISGRVPPGERLDEAALGRQFSVSRTPVREAFLQLAAVDLIQFQSRQGAIVATIPLARVAQMFEVMAELEALCARLASERMTTAERKDFKSAAARCEQFANSNSSQALDNYFQSNYAFHQILYQGAHNEYLFETTMQLRNRLTPYRRFRLQSPARLKVSSSEHNLILDAVLAGDGDRAAMQTRTHLTIQSAVLADIVSAFSRRGVELPK